MDLIPILLLVVGAAAVIGVAWSSYSIWEERYSERSHRFRKRLEELSEFARQDQPATLKVHHLSQWPWLDALLQRWPLADHLDRLIQRSGKPVTVSDILLACMACSLMAIVVLIAIGMGVFPCLLGAALAGVPPWILLRVIATRRQILLESQLPDVLDFIARSMQAGHAFNSALQMAATESPQPIGSEFQQAFNEVNVGMPVQQAMTLLADRIDCADMRYFAVSVLINREIGGDLSGLLKGVAALIRERLKLRQSIKALTAEARASAWVLGVLPFLLAGGLVLLNPEYMAPLWTDPVGRKLVTYGLLLMVIGVLWMNRLSKVRA